MQQWSSFAIVVVAVTVVVVSVELNNQIDCIY